MNIWKFQRVLSQRLIAWNLFNFAAGFWLSKRGEFWRGFGSQHLGWSLINFAIAFFGLRANSRRILQPDRYDPAVMQREGRKLRLILWVNSGLDLLYMLGGFRLARRSASKPMLQGIGWGIVLQGALLFVFDVLHAPRVPHEPVTGSAVQQD